MNEGVEAHWHIRPLSAIILFSIKLKNSDKACERRKRGRERAEPSNPKRTKGSFRCRVSIDIFTHPHSFIRRAGFPGRCQLLLHTIKQDKRVWPLWGLTLEHTSHRNIYSKIHSLMYRCSLSMYWNLELHY